MKYFLDIEGTRATAISEIGIVREDGKTFSSNISYHSNKTIPDILLYLQTGEIKQDDESYVDIVFENLFDWLFEDESNIEIYCWGSMDAIFLKNTSLYSCSRKARKVLEFLKDHLIDYSNSILERFKITQPSLIKTYNCFYPMSPRLQTHHALEDAILLFDTFQLIETHENSFVNQVLKSYPDEKQLVKNIVALSKNTPMAICTSMNEAVSWIMNEQGMSKDTDRISIANKIEKAIATKTKYCNYKWERV